MSREEFEDLFPQSSVGTRALHCLVWDRGIDSLEKLSSHSEDELLRIRLFGQKSLVLVKEILAAHGLSLAPNRERPKREERYTEPFPLP